MAAPPQPPESPEESVFSEARDKFLASLSVNDQLMYSPCASSHELLQAVKKLARMTVNQRSGRRHKHKTTQWMSAISKLGKALEPYFKVVELFVSSNPDITDSFPQYQIALEAKLGNKSTELVRKHVGAIYGVLLQIFHAAVRVFTKADGKLKRTPVVIGKLMWTPFDVRFAELTEVLSRHRHTLIEILNVSSAAALSDEVAAASNNRQQTAAEWDRSRDEREAAANERAAAAKERLIANAERHDHSEWRQEISSKLDHIAHNFLLGKQTLNEAEHMDELFTTARKAISSPNYEDSRDIASSMRLDGTSQWVFSTREFQCWSNGPSTPEAEVSSKDGVSFEDGVSSEDEDPFEDELPFRDNVLWITGKPGAGKTVLAASILDHLEQDCPQTQVLYFFFRSQSPDTQSVDAARRALLAQVLWKLRGEVETLDKLAFASERSKSGQAKYTSSVVSELLRLCLPAQAVIVLDGIDECSSSADVLQLIQDILPARPKTRFLLLSRINVPRLKHLVPDHLHLEFSAASVSNDLARFFASELHRLKDQAMLPKAPGSLEPFVQQLVRGADGMFLWARLMINFLESPTMTRQQRVEVIEKVTAPEGLEKLYERIFIFIASTGPRALGLASKCLVWLTREVVPMNSHHLREALVIQQCLGESALLDSIAEFEESVLITCAGLIERYPGPIAHNSLRLVHISIKETLDSLVVNRVWIDQYLSRGLHYIISDIAGAFIDTARCCLLELTKKKAQQTADDEVKSITESANHMANRFVVHAASNMLNYLEEAALSMRSVDNLNVHVRSAIREALTHLLPILSDFVNKPAHLSRWLFEFYKSRPVGHPQRTAMSAFAHWIRRHWYKDMVVDEPLLQVLATFDKELARIVADWGGSLQQRPDIIWDEMASFSNSRLFYNPGSTLVSYQGASAPTALGIWSRPLTTISKTTTSGDMKGVLSIWTTLSLETLRSSHHHDLSVLSQDWVAKYELWSIEAEPRVRFSAELPIDEQDVRLTLKCWLSYPFPEQFWFPTAISDNAQSFSVLKTVFTLRRAGKGGSISGRHNICPDTYSHQTSAPSWTSRVFTIVAFASWSQAAGGMPHWNTYIHMWNFILALGLATSGNLSVDNRAGNDKLIIDSSRASNSDSPLVSLRGSSVMLEKATGDNDCMSAELIRLPTNVRMEHTNLQVSLPREAGNAIGINIDAAPREAYSLSTPMPIPMYIQRDPRFVATYHSPYALGAQGSAPQAAIDSSPGIIPKGKQVGKRTMIDSEIEQQKEEGEKDFNLPCGLFTAEDKQGHNLLWELLAAEEDGKNYGCDLEAEPKGI
ncbi:hypothetical protein PG997_015064 [Apiospora hydei]|uniref:NACHT domain-containing protein n=1 Tax=Apiospora hydei TaxID=1337664 RepID=A0ABR1UVP5_9PEZI